MGELSNNQPVLSWTDESASGAVNYKLLRWNNFIDPDPDFVIVYSGSGLTYEDLEASAGEWAYQVVAENSAGDDSLVSNVVQLTVPA